MSSDARIWRGDNGWSWTGNHDGPCVSQEALALHDQPANLSWKIAEIEACVGSTLRWEVDEPREDGVVILRGWHA